MLSTLSRKILSHAIEFAAFYNYGRLSKAKRNELCYIKWDLPHEGWIILNIDRSARGNLGIVGVGGLLRDQNGK